MTLGSHQAAIGKSQDWITPLWLISDLGMFDLDPCASVNQPWPCAITRYTEDGLLRPWFGCVWLNPPFHRYQVGAWVMKLAQHGDGIALLHARTEAAWFDPIWQSAVSIGFLKDRIHFHKPDGSRAAANSGAPAVLAAFGWRAHERMVKAKTPMHLVTDWR